MSRSFFYLHNCKPMVVEAREEHEGTWYLPQLDIVEHESNLFDDAFDFYHSRLSKVMPPRGAKPTKVPYMWVINGEKQ